MKENNCLLGRQGLGMEKCDGRCSVCGFDRDVAETRQWMIRKNGIRKHNGLFRLLLPPQRDRESSRVKTWQEGKEHETETENSG